MREEQTYSLKAIEQRLSDNDLPFSGRTELDSAYFTFLRPSFICATAIHASGQIRDELHPKLKIGSKDRLREEDPGTDCFLKNFPIRITALDSRYEYDINRETARAIYDVAWGVEVWKDPPTGREKLLSLAKHAEFHKLMDIIAEYLIRDNDYGIIFDLHSFNYRRTRGGENTKPDINIGTGPVNRGRFGDLIDDFISRLKEITINGTPLRVAENEIFTGGYLSRRLSSEYYDKLLVLAIEFKKIYMDEWTGEIFEPVLEELVDKFTQVVVETSGT